jgi:hypothetical protein
LLECVEHGRVASCGGYEPYPWYGLRRLLSAGGVEGTKNKTTDYQNKEFFFHSYKPRYFSNFITDKVSMLYRTNAGLATQIALA